jgi:hypothetical protein
VTPVHRRADPDDALGELRPVLGIVEELGLRDRLRGEPS